MTTQEGNKQPQDNLFKYKKPDYKAIVDKAIGEKPNLVKENIIKAVREQSRFVTLGVDGPVRIRTTRINNDKQDTK
jgi:hypothetical protein